VEEKAEKAPMAQFVPWLRALAVADALSCGSD